jgi:glycosyltransferase involved in cell wall biosynthesis
MKVLIVNKADKQGGAAKAAYRLHQALLAENIESRMLVQNKSSDDYTVIGPETKIKKVLYMMRNTLDQLPLKSYQNRNDAGFSPAWLPFGDIVNKINAFEPDIVHLHWINAGMMKLEDILKINAPIVWSLHDNWLFTGGCHVKWECEKYIDNCGSCPNLGSQKENDLSRKVWKRKQKVFSQLNQLTIVGLSKWITECSKNSLLLRNHRHINIPNPINTNLFKPYNKKNSRELWGLPENKKLILFGAIDATSNTNKGFMKLKEALHLFDSKDTELVIFGSSEPEKPIDFGFKVHYLGYLSDDISLITLYSAVDVMIVPSLQENLSNVIMEAMSCGTPVVCFDVGGNSDMVEHMKNGYLATPYNTSDLANGIEWILNTSDYDIVCKSARMKIVTSFSNQIVVQQYINLYKRILLGEQ